MARARSSTDGHDSVGGVLVGEATCRPPADVAGPELLAHVHECVNNLLVVVSLVADAELANGFERSSQHYRDIYAAGVRAQGYISLLMTGTLGLKATYLSEIQRDLSRLNRAVECLVTFVPANSAGVEDASA